MSFWPILLRAVLCVSLILNGSGYAMASAPTRMGHTAASITPPVAEPTAAVVQPCHEQPIGKVAPAVSSPDAAQDGMSVAPTQAATDCCESGACRCDCAQHAQATLPTSAPIVASIEHMRSMCALQAGHIAPALWHLVRPPIA